MFNVKHRISDFLCLTSQNKFTSGLSHSFRVAHAMVMQHFDIIDPAIIGLNLICMLVCLYIACLVFVSQKVCNKMRKRAYKTSHID